MRLRIPEKINLVLFIFLAEILAAASFFVLVKLREDRFIRKYTQEITEVGLVGQLQAAVNESVMPLNDFLVLNNDKGEVANFWRLDAKFQELTAILNNWKFDTAIERETFSRIKDQYRQIKEISLKVFSLPDASSNPQASWLMKKADKLASDSSEEFRSFFQSSLREAKEIETEQAGFANLVKLFISVAIVFNILLILFVSIFFRMTITLPLVFLKVAASEIGKGNLDAKVNIKSKDELGELGAVFNKMVEDLKAAQAQLIQAERAGLIGGIAGGVAHEVRNSLSVVLQGMDYLSLEALNRDPACVSILKTMDDSIRRIESIIRALLEISGSAEISMMPLNLNSVIEESLLLIQYPAKQANILVAPRLEKDIPCIMADRAKIVSAFVSLLMNAMESMPKGGQLRVSTYDTHAQEALGQGRKTKVVVEVEDTGTGISKEIQDKIFTPFVTSRADKGGIGLGLWMVKNIMDLHNARIKIENKKDDRGVKVTVVFEASSLKEDLASDNHERGKQALDKIKILIVDDQEGFTRMVKLNLELGGRFEVRTESKGTNGLTAAKEFKPNLILLDIGMPDMNGSKVLKLLKAEEATKNIPVVFVTGLIKREDLARADGTIDGQPFIVKPVGRKALLDCIERNLRISTSDTNPNKPTQ